MAGLQVVGELVPLRSRVRCSLARYAQIALATWLLLACNDPGAARTVSASAAPAGSNEAGASSSPGTANGGQPQHLTRVDTFTPQALVPSGGAGGTNGSSSRALIAPFGISTGCGDAIVGANEECDDGNEGSDACTALCQTRDQLAVGVGDNADRYLGAGRHPVSGLDSGFINTFVEFSEDEASIGATLFNVWGQATHHVNVSDGASPIDDANPVAAALPSGAYAVAWGDLDGDGSDLGVALRLVNADGSLRPLGAANAAHEFSQLNPDILWAGTQLIVAWEDYSDAFNGPDLRYRLFDADLNPVSDDVTLAASALPEAAVALAPFQAGWAAAYREGTVDGKENVVVRVGPDAFRVGPVQGGPLDDRPALVELDATHLLLVFSAGTDPGLTGTCNVPRIRYSVIDVAGASTQASEWLEPLDGLFTFNTQVSHLSPAAERAAEPGSAYVAWRSEARPGDAAGDQIWLKYLRWDPVLGLRVREQEQLAPRICEGSFGDQRTPALARTQLPPEGALAIAWDDYSHSQGPTAGDPDVVVHYAPTHERAPAQGNVFRETWTQANGALPSYWSSTIIGPATLSVVSQKANVLASGAASAAFWVNDVTALNVDMTTKVVWNLNGARAQLMARMSDGATKSYFAAYFGTLVNDKWRLYWGDAAGVAHEIATAVQPPIFTNYAQKVEYRLRFRVVTNADQSIFLGGKIWGSDVAEPAGWTMQTTLAAGSAAALAMASQSGRFGLVGAESQAGRQTTFDDLEVRYYDGAYAGTFEPAVQAPTPLMRAPAKYRACQPGQTCGAFEGCCTANADCGADLSCVKGFGDYARLGTNVDVCLANHCANKILDGGEAFADCGGPDCAACTCTSTKLPGQAGYCSSSCPCGAGGTDCTTSADCLPGLTCYPEMGYRFGYAAGTDTCLPPHCLNRYQDADETGIDTGNSCGNVACPPASSNWCTVSCPCTSGKGDCDYNDECVAGLVCSTKGANFGLSYNVCVAPHCTDKVLNFGETKVDCGGPDCGSICP
jgi:hypothetical protein